MNCQELTANVLWVSQYPNYQIQGSERITRGIFSLPQGNQLSGLFMATGENIWKIGLGVLDWLKLAGDLHRKRVREIRYGPLVLL